MRKLGAVNDANYCNYMGRKLRAWYRRFPPKQAATDSAADVTAWLLRLLLLRRKPRILPLQPMQLLRSC